MKKEIKIKSVFEQISTEVFKMNNVNDAKEYINEFIESKSINEMDKKVITINITNCKRIGDIHRYICNSLLKYEGMGVK